MIKEINKTKDKVLTIKVAVGSKVEAYDVVSRLGFDCELVSAEFEGQVEKFGKEKKPSQFLRKSKKVFRDIRAERLKK